MCLYKEKKIEQNKKAAYADIIFKNYIYIYTSP